MALATLCPHCGTMFRVASDQLKLRGGIVRCGACQEIFDGSASLVDLDALPVRAPAAATPPAAAQPEAAAAEMPAVAPAPALPDTPALAEVQAAPEVPAEPEAPAASDAPIQPEPAALAPEPAPAGEATAAPDAPAAVAADAEPVSTAPAVADAATPAAPDFDDQPVYTLDFDHTFDPFGILPKVAAPEQAASGELVDSEPAAQPQPAEPAQAAPGDPADEPAPPPYAPPTEIAYPPAGRIEPSFDLPVDEEIVATALPGHDDEGRQQDRQEPVAAATAAAAATPRAVDAPPVLPMREAAGAVIHTQAPAPSAPPVARTPSAKRADKAAARRSRLTPTKIDAAPKIRVPESDEPEFVKRSRQQEQSGRTRKIAMLAGSTLLLLVLLAQGAFTFRNALAARFPGAKPALVSGCAVFGCRVELPAQVDNLVIETGELTTLGGGAYAFSTQLRNQGAVPQAWPSLELSLTDANDKPLVRRVFAPRDYLNSGSSPGAAAAATGLAPRVEQAITLHFRVDDLQPSGYHIAVFYP